MKTDDVDAIVLSACVQMPSLAAIAQVEAATGKPVVTAAVATTYAMLSELGLEQVVPGAGALLSGAYQRRRLPNVRQHLLYGAQVRANDIRQHYLRYGGNKDQRAERDAVIIVPGITSPAVTWGFVAERFGRQFDTYVLDVRGRGLSEASSALDYSLDACC
jgi:hypothetical protein